jgi:hypothetical protein
MPSSDLLDGKMRGDQTPQDLRNSAETLSNILYLIQQTLHDPKSIRELLKMAEGPMETLRNLASRRREEADLGSQLLAPREGGDGAPEEPLDPPEQQIRSANTFRHR